MEKLNQIVLDIEFLLISVVQGVALAALAAAASGLTSNFQLESWLYILSGFLLILIFWSQAIIHAISFIDWPPDLSHNFLYFLAALFEVLIFNQIENPLGWFAFTVIFFIIAGVLYILDLSLIKFRKDRFKGKKQALYQHILKRQLLEIKIMVPLGLIFNTVSVILLYRFPGLLGGHLNLILISLQILFGIAALYDSLDSFKGRIKLITNSLD